MTAFCKILNSFVRPIEWDPAAMKVTNLPSANQYLTKVYRPGFGV